MRPRPRGITGALLAMALAAALLPALGTTGATTASAATASAATTGAATPFKASGHFYISKRDNRWFFVTPTGQPFYSAGIDHVAMAPDTDQVTGRCPYCDAIAGRYATPADWATATAAQLRSWGFNSLGPFSDVDTFADQMPYSIQLGMASGDDWFAPAFATHADQVAATQVAPRANDPDLIGWYTDSELDWGPNGSDLETQLDHYLALPAGSPGLAVAQRYVGNPNGFVYALATRYFQVTTAAVRRYDPNHLILGVKAEAQEIQPELLEAAQPYVDVFSIDDYTLWPGFAQIIDKVWPQYLPVTSTLNTFERYVKRPLMVGEYSFVGQTPQTPDTIPGVYATYPTQLARADAYTGYVAPLYQDAPWVVGDEWFEYVDEPQGGRFDGENNDFGVLDVEAQPYPELVDALQVMHSIAPDRAAAPGPACDAWAPTGDGGATCTATMAEPTYPLQVFSTTLAPATQARGYSQEVIAIGGRPGYHFALAAGSALPAGLALDPTTGRLSGYPHAHGSFTFSVTVTDSTGPIPQTTSGALALTIAPPAA